MFQLQACLVVQRHKEINMFEILTQNMNYKEMLIFCDEYFFLLVSLTSTVIIFSSATRNL